MISSNLLELLVVIIVALIVLGPEQLPKILSKLGQWLHLWRRMNARVNETIEKQLRHVELQNNIARANAAEENPFDFDPASNHEACVNENSKKNVPSNVSSSRN